MRERMILRDGCDQPFFSHRDNFQFRNIFRQAEPDEPKVDPVEGDLFDLSRRIHFAQEKLYVWESFPEEAKNAWKQAVGEGWNKSNRERAAFSAVDPARSS